jgi:hypothetical protein
MAAPKDKVFAALIMSAGIFNIDLQQLQQKTISQLPIMNWNVNLRMDMQMETDLVAGEVYTDIVSSGLMTSLKVSAKHPTLHEQVYSVAIDMNWVKRLHFLYCIYRLRRFCILEASIQALSDVWEEVRKTVNAIESSYRHFVNVSEILQNMLRNCADKKSAKDLRHRFRGILESIAVADRESKEKEIANNTALNERRDNEGKCNSNGKILRRSTKLDPVEHVNMALAELQRQFEETAIGAQVTAECKPEVRNDDTKAINDDRVIQQPAKPRLEEKQEALTGGLIIDTSDAMVRESNTFPVAAAAKPVASAIKHQSKQTMDKEAGPPNNEKSKRWALLEDPKILAPSVTMSIAGVNSWGVGDYSEYISVNVQHSLRLLK